MAEMTEIPSNELSENERNDGIVKKICIRARGDGEFRLGPVPQMDSNR